MLKMEYILLCICLRFKLVLLLLMSAPHLVYKMPQKCSFLVLTGRLSDHPIKH